MAAPFYQEWYANSAFERRALRPAQRRIARGVDCCARHRRSAVVAEKKDERVVVEVFLVQLVQHFADRIVHCRHHASVGLATLVFYVLKLLKPVVRCIHRRMNRVEGQIEKERFVRLLIDEPHGLAAKSVGEILLFLNWLVVAQDCWLRAREIPVRAAEKSEAVLKTAALRNALRSGAQMPLADPAGFIAGGLQAVGHCGLRDRKTVLLAVAGIKLVTESRLITAGKHAGTRGRTVRGR